MKFCREALVHKVGLDSDSVFLLEENFLHHPRFSGQNRAAEMKAQKRSLEQKVMVPRISSRQLCEVKRSDQSLPFCASLTSGL